MLQNSTRFSRLVDLAKETSSDKRRELLREVSDVFLKSSLDLSDVERSYFGDIIGKVSANMDVAVRRRLAEQFAGQPKAPLGLIQQLANDEFSVAASVLRKSKVLRDVDLIAIAQGKDQEKLGVMALGAALPFVLVVAVLLAQGVLGRFWFWTFHYARAYVSEVSIVNALPGSILPVR